MTLPIFFKYRSGEAALRCLTDDTLYFARPDQLNDTLEAKFDDADTEEFVKVMSAAISEINQQRGNAALDFNRVGLREMHEVNIRENRRLQEFTEQVGIFSASRRPDDQAMWAYYAEDAKGVCFELEWTPALLSQYQLISVDVRYESKARIHNRANDWAVEFRELAADNPGASALDLLQLAAGESARRKWGINTAVRAVSLKHTDWQHENEIRLISPKSRAIPVLSGVLKRVHYIRNDGEDWGKIMQLLQEKYPSVELLEWQFHHGAISARNRQMEFRMAPLD